MVELRRYIDVFWSSLTSRSKRKIDPRGSGDHLEHGLERCVLELDRNRLAVTLAERLALTTPRPRLQLGNLLCQDSGLWVVGRLELHLPHQRPGRVPFLLVQCQPGLVHQSTVLILDIQRIEQIRGLRCAAWHPQRPAEGGACLFWLPILQGSLGRLPVVVFNRISGVVRLQAIARRMWLLAAGLCELLGRSAAVSFPRQLLAFFVRRRSSTPGNRTRARYYPSGDPPSAPIGHKASPIRSVCRSFSGT